MNILLHLELWQIVIAILYLSAGTLLAIIGSFLSDMAAGMGSAFGYPSHKWGLLENFICLFFWPVCILSVLILLAITSIGNRK